MRDVVGDLDARPDGSRLVLAHRRVDVRELNEAIRTARQERGELTGEKPAHDQGSATATGTISAVADS